MDLIVGEKKKNFSRKWTVLDDGGAGPATNGGDAAVAAKPKTKSKDGEGFEKRTNGCVYI